MYRLIYVSKKNTSMFPELENIMASSRRNNAKLRITGALFLLNGIYCQYIEGDEDVVRNLYWKLLSDVRHKDLKLLDSSSITERLFTDWSLALVEWNEQTRAFFKALDPIATFDFYAMSAATAYGAFELLARSSRSQNLASPT